MNRRIFLKLTTTTFFWLGLLQNSYNRIGVVYAQDTGEPSDPLPKGAYGVGSYGTDTYGQADTALTPEADVKTFLPVITKEE